MARILLAWELGSSFGHLSRLKPLAEALQVRGHRVDFAIRELHRDRAVLGEHRFMVLQAPVWLGRVPPLVPAPSYAGVIRRCGYHSHATLAALVDAWSRLLELTDPQLVVTEHAPTAALAARCNGIPSLPYGDGWAVPPDTTPLPTVTPWARSDPQRLRLAEAQVLGVVNAVLKGRGRPPLARLADLFSAGAGVLVTFPETDHYGAREGARYWGAMEQPVAATLPEWPAGPGPKIFGFIESTYPGLSALVRDLAALGLPTLLYVRDLPASKARQLCTPSLSVVVRPVDLAAAAGVASLVICHGGHGSIAGTLKAGKPLLLLPQQAEQRLLAWRVGRTGAALAVAVPRIGSADHAAAIRRVLDNASFADAAGAIARRHAACDRDRAIGAVADLCEAAIASSALRPVPDGLHAS